MPGCGSYGTADANGDAGCDAPGLNVEAGPGDDGNPCAPGEASCNGTCIDVTHDDANCGACATTCTGGRVVPPAGIDTDTAANVVPYGTRVSLLAIGEFARKGTVSHVTMEHSSVVRFLEYNFLGPVGQLAASDAKVRNIGSLLDPALTGILVPE